MERLTALELPNTLCEKVDVTDKTSFEAAIIKAEEQFGPADLLVNNAGVMLLTQSRPLQPSELLLDKFDKGCQPHRLIFIFVINGVEGNQRNFPVTEYRD